MWGVWEFLCFQNSNRKFVAVCCFMSSVQKKSFSFIGSTFLILTHSSVKRMKYFFYCVILLYLTCLCVAWKPFQFSRSLCSICIFFLPLATCFSFMLTIKFDSKKNVAVFFLRCFVCFFILINLIFNFEHIPFSLGSLMWIWTKKQQQKIQKNKSITITTTINGRNINNNKKYHLFPYLFSLNIVFIQPLCFESACLFHFMSANVCFRFVWRSPLYAGVAVVRKCFLNRKCFTN